jgi:hypothetical protein
MDQVQDGRIKIKARLGTFPTFMYDKDVEYDRKETDKGLCRGHFLLRVSDHSCATGKLIKLVVGLPAYLHRAFVGDEEISISN